MDVSECRVCGNRAGNARLRAREMMFGTGDEFDYDVCAACGCMQITRVPDDLPRHYPTAYYSLVGMREPRVVRALKGLRVRAVFGSRHPVGLLLLHRLGAPPAIRAVRDADVAFDTRVLDVGCGAGHVLQLLRAAGYRDLTGIDPFLAADTEPVPGVRLVRAELTDVAGPFGFVMLHHSLEHVSDPEVTLRRVHRVLGAGGRALVRTPVAGSYAARTYGANWVQLDAPRHLTVQSERSLRLLAERVGFRVERVVYDSSAFQFWGSEQYRRGVPLRSPASVAAGAGRDRATRRAMRDYEQRAAALNASGDGDQACFYLVRDRA